MVKIADSHLPTGLPRNVLSRLDPELAELFSLLPPAEVKIVPGAPDLRNNSDFCYIPGNSVDDYRPWDAGHLVPADSDIILKSALHHQWESRLGPLKNRFYGG